MSYRIKISTQVAKFLKNLPSGYISKLEEKFSLIAQNPYHKGLDIKKLRGYDNDYRFRWGKYRILYTIIPDEEIILIYKADVRGDVYK
jgi:mRNA interferase RelE/StbE